MIKPCLLFQEGVDRGNISLERGKKHQILYTNATSFFSQMLNSHWGHSLPHEEVD